MKTIFVATDFSPAARNASMYGMELAKAFNARLILFNAYQPLPTPVNEPAVIVTPGDVRKLVEQNLEAEARSINMWHVVTVETRCKEGDASTSILESAKDNNADIVIAGMKGSSKRLGRLFGSTVTDLIRKAALPLIIVPEDVRYARIDTIALANDSDIEPGEDPHILDSLKEIAERFSPKLYLVRIAKNEFMEAFEVYNRPFRLTKMMETLDPVYECVRAKNVTRALNTFVDAYHVNMLALVPHKHSIPEKWFVKSKTRTMTFEAQIPLLILPGLHAGKRGRKASKEALLEKRS
jgi:nucleotide-binding universal stress UspA family protein